MLNKLNPFIGFNFIAKSLKNFVIISLCILFSTLQLKAQITVQNPCAIDTAGTQGLFTTATTFYANELGSTDWEWDFGDGTPKQKGKIVQHQYLIPNSYNVTLTRIVNGLTATSNQLVLIGKSPEKPKFLSSYAKLDTSTCDPFILKPYKNGANPNYTYVWYPTGATTATIKVDSSDLYSVKVTDKTTISNLNPDGCYIVASVKVSICGSKPKNALAEYHFGNGIKQESNHGDAQNATEFPNNVNIVDGGVLSSTDAASSISNSTAFRYYMYLFSTDGTKIVKKDGKVIDTGLIDIGTKALSTLILPQIEGDTSANTKFYILTINDQGKLSYTLADSRPKVEQGDVVILEKNVELQSGLSGKLAPSKYFTGIGYYTVTHDEAGNYYTYKVTKFGLEGPIKSTSPNILGANKTGQMKFSPDGKTVAMVMQGPPNNRIEIANFDSTTGVLSGFRTILIGNTPPELFGLEFSPNGKYIYATTNSPTESQLLQIDLATNAILIISNTETDKKYIKYGALQAVKLQGQTPSILMSNDNEKNLSLILFPDNIFKPNYLVGNADTTLKVRQETLKYFPFAYRFGTAKSTMNLSNSVVLPANPSPESDNMSFEDDCIENAIRFQATPKCDVDPKLITYEWDFGDGSTPTAINKKQNSSHIYNKSGTYLVRLFITYCGKTPLELKDSIYIAPKPIVDLAKTYEYCFRDGKTHELIVNLLNKKELDLTYPDAITYQWNLPILPPEDETNKVTIAAIGKYVLTTTYLDVSTGANITCESNDSTIVTQFCEPILVLPTIFTPNTTDTINNEAEPLLVEVATKSFEFRIFNRWGELVYFSTNPNETRWDGKFKGKDLESDTYAWTAIYKSIFKPNGITYKKQGAILLAR